LRLQQPSLWIADMLCRYTYTYARAHAAVKSVRSREAFPPSFLFFSFICGLVPAAAAAAAAAAVVLLVVVLVL
jgi:hypothetical protein